jgi:hypothetical protein
MTESFTPAQPPWPLVARGKVREIYAAGEDRLLLVASDRISAYDHVLPTPIPDKGRVLTALSVWWFEQLEPVLASFGATHHLVSATDVPPEVAGRAMLVHRLSMLPVECVARGYLSGSGTVEYQRTGSIRDVPLPAGLVEGSRLPEPVFTPSTKAAVGEHDEAMEFAAVVDAVGDRRGRRDHPGRHEVRVRPRRRGEPGAGRRGAHPRLVPLLARDHLVARRPAALVRQAVRARLADHLGLGPRLAAARAARRRRRRHPRPLRHRLRAPHRAHFLLISVSEICTLALIRPVKPATTQISFAAVDSVRGATAGSARVRRCPPAAFAHA